MTYTKRQPTVIQVPGNGQPIQVPISDDSIISLSNIGSVALSLSTDESFTNTWPIAIGEVQPEPGIDNLWIMNTSGTDSEVLVLTYDARFPGLVAPPSGPGGSGYASLTGPGQSTTPGALTQEGDFTVVAPDSIQFLVDDISDNSGLVLDNGATLSTSGDAGVNLSSNGGARITLNASNGGADQTILLLDPSDESIKLQSLELSFYGESPVVRGDLTGSISSITDPNARAVLAMLVNLLDAVGIILNSTT